MIGLHMSLMSFSLNMPLRFTEVSPQWSLFSSLELYGMCMIFFPHLLYVIKFYQKTTATVKSFSKSGRAHSDGALEKNLIST